jgi:hypothetical protein
MHVREEDIELYILGRLARPHLPVIEAHLVGCASCQQKAADAAKVLARLAGLSTGAAGFDGRDKRKDRRISTDDSALLRVLSPLSFDKLEVRILDVSRGGLKVQVPISLSIGTIVQIPLRKTVAFGEVRYCIPAGNEFHAGVQVHDSLTAGRTADGPASLDT